ncbi:hypothetical protein NVP1052A_20 [Vibrio phage 1.052.A._10N.286.46.C3]|nr:hypothetical protein NVP1052A_20 [Vibrio phage 1.052.A._10N.286.46.C3]
MRIEELQETINAGLLFTVANLHTVTLCQVTKVNEKTINCKPVINRVVDGVSEELPVFEDVPPIFMQGGGSYTAHPISEGDYALVLISERCFDAWYGGDNFVSPLEMRMHDYSDGFALVGVNPESSAITIPDVITQIGDMFAQGNWEHEGALTRTGDETVTGTRQHDGDVTVTGTMTAATSVLGQASFDSIQSSGETGVSGSFQSADNKTIVVTNGIITGIS